MNRAERKAAADKRRADWKLQFLDVTKAAVVAGNNSRDAFGAAAKVATDLCQKHPTLKSEIELAFREFINAVVKVSKEMQATA